MICDDRVRQIQSKDDPFPTAKTEKEGREKLKERMAFFLCERCGTDETLEDLLKEIEKDE